MPAWSYSALTSFETCPRKHYETRVAKRVSEAPSEEMTWGNNVHKALERRAKEGKPLPVGMTQWEPMMRRLLDLPGDLLAETQYALDQDFKPTEWFSQDVWLRAIIDFGKLSTTSAVALDYKTGKVKTDIDQLRLFAAVLLTLHPDLEQVHTGYVWLKSKSIHREVYTRQQEDELWAGFLPRVSRLERAYRDDTWPERPSGLCRAWCPVVNCRHNGRH